MVFLFGFCFLSGVEGGWLPDLAPVLGAGLVVFLLVVFSMIVLAGAPRHATGLYNRNAIYNLDPKNEKGPVNTGDFAL